MELVQNYLANRAAPYSAEATRIVSRRRSEAARDAMAACGLFASTPLRAFERLAAQLELRAVYVKDESYRLGLSSFKALGGAYAVTRHLRRRRSGAGTAASDAPVFVTATDGNHGISVAAGARISSARSVIFLPAHVEAPYEQTMRALGAEIVRTRGSYDEAVAAAASAAATEGWTLVADTTDADFDTVTRDVMDGYGVLLIEVMEQLKDRALVLEPHTPTHLFVQGGVGGLAAALAGGLWQRMGPRRPTIVVVEPQSADCLFQSALQGRPVEASGDLATSMGMLSCGRPSRMAWRILQTAADHFMLIDDRTAAMGAQAYSAGNNYGRYTTPSGGAGLGGLLKCANDSLLRRAIGLDEDSVVLTVCTEGPPDPEAIKAAFENLGADHPRQDVGV